jgi:integrase
MCDMLYTVAAWLRQEELIPDTAALPRRNWKVRLKQEWKALTGHQVQPKRPRHTVEEVSALFRALPGADPRLRLLVELAAELRAGQAARARRSDLILEPVGGFGLGRFVVHGNGKKHGEVVDLHPELRALVDETLATGYLSDAEIAYRWEEIPNYYLFPAGRLRRGKVRVDLAKAGYLGATAIRDMFRALEKLAGVEHQPGRSLYGLRRQATDLAPEFAQDAGVLNRLSGHLDSATRERIYQDPMNEVVLARAAKARRDMRQCPRSGREREAPRSRPIPDLSQTYPRPIPDLSQSYPRVIPPPPEREKPQQRKRRQGFHLLQSGRRDLNPRPPEPHSGALPGCATSRNRRFHGDPKATPPPMSSQATKPANPRLTNACTCSSLRRPEHPQHDPFAPRPLQM